MHHTYIVGLGVVGFCMYTLLRLVTDSHVVFLCLGESPSRVVQVPLVAFIMGDFKTFRLGARDTPTKRNAMKEGEP